jgi:hypothetical protein
MHTLRNTLLAALLLIPITGLANVPAGLKPVGTGEAFYLKVIKVYDASLSVSSNASRDTVLDATVSRCLTLDYAVDLTADKFALAADTILKRQQNAATLQQLKPQLEQWHGAYQDVKLGDVYQMCYDAKQQASTLVLNAETLTTVKSAAFASVYFSIWLGEKQPIAQVLREELLEGL